MKKCEICDRDTRKVWQEARLAYDGAWFLGELNPYPGPFPAGDGRGVEVPHTTPAWRAVFALPFPEAIQFDVEQARFRHIFTCGDPLCMFRAKHHGMPGAVYQQPIRRTESSGVDELLGEILVEAVRRGVAEVRVHPKTFYRIAYETGARVTEDPRVRCSVAAFIDVPLPGPSACRIISDPDVAVVDHLYWPTTGPATARDGGRG